ncbi:MAG: hypothetical protein DRN30_03095 [Thermoplasmata archaeon]|nr:MAG: hypothetical protein DRN30_03095 [Thermoplasmata archaeon]
MANMRSIKRAAQKPEKKPQEMKLLGLLAGRGTKQKMDQLDSYVAMVMKLIHNEEARPAVLEMLRADPDPMVSIPGAANTIGTKISKSITDRGAKAAQDVEIASFQFMVNDLAQLADSEQIYAEPVATEEKIGGLMQASMQKYIETGLASRSIDPIQLQRETEMLMNEQQKEVGMGYAPEGMPTEPTTQMAANQETDAAVYKERQKTEAAQDQVSALEGQPTETIQPANPQPPPNVVAQ